MKPVVKHRVSYFTEGATIFHMWYCCPDYMVRTGKMGCVLIVTLEMQMSKYQ